MLRSTTRADVHLPTILAIGVVSFAAVTVLHEAGGHGVACLLVGGEAPAVSSTELRCDGPEGAARLAVTAAASLANIVVGVAAMAAGIALGRPVVAGRMCCGCLAPPTCFMPAATC